MNQEEIDLKHLLALFLSKLWLIILMGIIGAAAGFGISKFVLPLKYSSHISMYVQCYTSVKDSEKEISNITMSKQLINTYIEVLKDDAVLSAVGAEISGIMQHSQLEKVFPLVNGIPTPASIRSSLSISSVTDTSALKITSTTTDPEASALICNSMAHVAPRFLSEAVGVGSINTIDTARVYRTPVGPNTMKNTALGGIAGVMLMLGIIFMIDFFDNTVKNTEMLSEKYRKPIIGEIQAFGSSKERKRKRKTGEDTHFKLTDENIPFSVVESYKSIRTNVSFSLSTSEQKILAVSSANPAEGKSTVSANIAIVQAQSGAKTLLIDGDMRKAVQHKIFGLKNKNGLSSAISKMCKLEDCIQHNVMENLDVLTSGPIPPNPSELLASAQMGVILEKLAEKYDVIIIDTPPINVVTDAMELAKNVSGVVIVLRYGKTTAEEADAAMKKIEFSQMNMLGFILNDIEMKHSSCYFSRYGYRHGYGYGYAQAVQQTPADGKGKEKTS